MSASVTEHGVTREVEKEAESKVGDVTSTRVASSSTATDEKIEKDVQQTDLPAEEDDSDENPEAYPSGIRLICIVVSLCLAVFLLGLDGTIIATAIPRITDQFNSLSDIAWYTAAFYLTSCAFQLPYGRAYTLLNVKWTFISSLLIFLLGNTVCGATPSSAGLIIGRAIAGVGSAGVLGGVFIIIAKNIPLRKRGLYAGFVGAAISISSVLGPIIGGALTERVSWRWCFYINLPVGAVILGFIFVYLPEIGKTSEDFRKLSWWQMFRKFNPVGTTILMVSVITLILALQWGGETGGWGQSRVIVLFVVFAVTIIIWAAMQYMQGEEATLPWSVAKQRSVAGASIYAVFGSAAFTFVVFWLPVWFQSVKGDNAEESGISSIPLMISIIVSSLGAGALTMVVGYYSIFLLTGTLFMIVGSALLMTLTVDSGPGYWIGYQIIIAAGLGMALEQCNIVVQTVLPDEQIPAGTSLVIFARSISASIAAAVGQNVYQSDLTSSLAGILPPEALKASGATTLLDDISTAVGDNQVLYDYVLSLVNDSITRVFMVALIVSCLGLPAALAIEWKSVNKEKRKNEDAKEQAGRTQKTSEESEDVERQV